TIVVILTVEKSASGGAIRVWTAYGDRRAVAVDSAVWDELARLAEEAEFWAMPTEESEDLKPHGRDGCGWTIYGGRGNERHHTWRYVPVVRVEQRGLTRLTAFVRRLFELALLDERPLC